MKTIIKSMTGRRVRNAVYGAVCASLIQAVSMAPAQADDANEESYLKDLDIRQVAIAKIEETQTLSETSPSKLKVSASVNRADHTYNHGDKVVLTIKTTKDAYVYVLDTGTSGKVHQIFPNKYAQENFVKANVPVAIPADDMYDFVVSHPKGPELLTVIASTDASPLTDNLIDGSAGPFMALRGTAESVAKDLSVSLRRDQHKDKDISNLVLYIK